MKVRKSISPPCIPPLPGYLGVWSVSSAKQGNGVASLRDGDLTTTWQSDGHVPHTITVTFQKRVHVVALRVYMDYGLDESYTPLRASVKVGTSGAPHDVSITLKAEWDEPRGWQTLWLGGKPDGSFPDATSHQHRPAGMCLWRLEIDLLQNHQNGRDSHVRQIQVLGPRGDSAGAPMTLLPLATTALATLQQRMEAPGRWSGLGRTGDEGRWEASTVPSHRRPPPPPSDTSATLARQFRSIR